MTTVTIKLEVPGGPDARVLLHACCAPCSGAIVETMVAQGIRPTIFWSNSNIYDKAEYDKRKAEILRYAEKFGLEVVDDDYDHAAWLKEAAAGLENEPERGSRCAACFAWRLSRAARYAAAHGFTVLATTLASSRWKSLEQVDAAGRNACEAVNGRAALPSDFPGRWEQKGPKTSLPSTISGRWEQAAGTPVTWWGQNWRVCGLQPRRSEIIREQNFYNQDFCGCEFSIRNK